MRRSIGNLEKGKIGIYILIGGIILLGTSFVFGTQLSSSGTNGDTTNSLPTNYNLSCCDTGNGEACKPRTDKNITFSGKQYSLIKSGVYINEGIQHLGATGEVTKEGRVYVNTSQDKEALYGGPDCTRGKDHIWVIDKPNKRYCIPIENDFLVYVCKSGSPICDQKIERINTVVFDVYIKTVPGQETIVPETIKYCERAIDPKDLEVTGAAITQTLQPTTKPENTKALQVGTFNVTQNTSLARWMSPFCKPAVYLYPEQTMPVNVQVEPKGDMLVTIPKYPSGGWHVIAQPNGLISAGKNWYDYLYYEAEIADELYSVPNQGYVLIYSELSTKLPQIVRDLGLNASEGKAFMDYWLKALPKAPYYAVRLIPQTTVDTIAPLTIVPAPDSLLRLAVHFEPLQEKIVLQEPVIASFSRKGFTVVEWGGIFKRKPGYEFSCFM